MRTIKICITLAVILCTTMSLQAQRDTTESKPPFKDRLVYGGGVILNFSNFGTALGLSPRVGYKVTDRYIAGVGLSYIYFSADQYKSNNYAASIFNNFRVLDEVFLHAELEYGRTQQTQSTVLGEQKFNYEYPALLLGGGYRQSGGGAIGVSFTVLYDVIQDRYSPYQQGLVYRGGIFVGL